MIRTTGIVHGNIQKADYRGRVISIAKEIDITGIIQNLSNGTVRIVAEGEPGNIERFYDEIWIRNFLIKVTDITKGNSIEIVEREYESFYKLVGEGETDERIDTAADILKKLGTDIGIFISEQRGHNNRMDSFIERMDEHNKNMDEHNLRLEKILEKLSER
jgi:acylphosphatase